MLGQSYYEGDEVGGAQRRRKAGAFVEELGVIKKQKRPSVSERLVGNEGRQRAWGGLASGEVTEAGIAAEGAGQGAVGSYDG